MVAHSSVIALSNQNHETSNALKATTKLFRKDRLQQGFSTCYVSQDDRYGVGYLWIFWLIFNFYKVLSPGEMVSKSRRLRTTDLEDF